MATETQLAKARDRYQKALDRVTAIREARHARGSRWGEARRHQGRSAQVFFEKLERAEQAVARAWDRLKYLENASCPSRAV